MDEWNFLRTVGFAGDIFRIELFSLHVFQNILSYFQCMEFISWSRLEKIQIWSSFQSAGLKSSFFSEMFPMLTGRTWTLKREGIRRHWYSISWIVVYLQNQMTSCTFKSQINQFNYEYLEGFHSFKKSLLTSCFSKIILSVHLLKQMNLELSSGLQKNEITCCNNINREVGKGSVTNTTQSTSNLVFF